jgi:predicted helicase
MAFAEDMVIRNGRGIVGMITSNTYLTNPTFRGMRWHLSQTFDMIYILDLHGSNGIKKRDVTPEGGADENIFDITDGVAIILAVKTGEKQGESPARIMHADLWGKRASKLKALSEEPLWQEVLPDKKFMFFGPRDNTGLDAYEQGIPVLELFKTSAPGMVSGRDSLTVDISRDTLWERIQNFVALDPEVARVKYDLKKDVRDWTVVRAQDDVSRDITEERLTEVAYRPFDARWTYYTGTSRGFYQYPRNDVMKHIRGRDNLVLNVGRQGAVVGGGYWNLVFATNKIVDFNMFRRGGEQVLPLYVYPEENSNAGRMPNLDNIKVQALLRNVSNVADVNSDYLFDHVNPEAVFDYIYGRLHSPEFRKDNQEFLKSDFPSIPIPLDDKEYERYRNAGTRLRNLHLLNATDIDHFATSFDIPGTNLVEYRKHDGDRLWINDTQYFGGLSKEVWTHQIGGYEPINQWFKDRIGTEITNDGIKAVQRMIRAVQLTRTVMAGIDSPSLDEASANEPI